MLHYLILSSFMWMLMEGILQYLLFVKVLGIIFHKYLLKTAIPAWGIPLIPVIVILAVDTNLYLGGDRYCWMALTPFYFAFLLPVGLIVLTNVIIYCLVIAAICSRRIEGSTSAESKSHFRVVGVRASLACFVILGLSWIFAFLAVADARLVFQYLFTITTTVQGFLLFVIFTARDPAFRTFWLEKCCGKSSHHSTSGAKARTRDVSGNSLESPMTRSTTCSDTRLDLISKRSPPPSPRKWPPSPSVPSSRI
ncbi:adhesion G-protein coupled receptor G2-like [Pomacea canaliculata]|uniref:adhesion G-protein coupled receptor G2-like n=1 Tax=Pomacea canaliculata TaxID=400727 RepID=UPI000D737A28|nr:adhesion G-protein coupled receptor G2-like [Pomacea canaliculata]